MRDKYVPFSVRSGRRQVPQLGLRDMPLELRVSLWNIIQPWIWNTRYGDEYRRRAIWVYNFHAIRWPAHEVPHEQFSSIATDRLHTWFMRQSSTDDIYDFVEALPQMIFAGMGVDPGDFKTLAKRQREQAAYVSETIQIYVNGINAMLERDGAPYRLVEGLLVPITNESELEEVRAAVSAGDRFDVARDHIREGLAHLGARPPAYADCIKQAVSAVESVLKIDIGDDTWRMPKLLKGFEEKHGALHPALREAIEKVYGYASDEEGVRHAAAAPVTVGEAEARALLITCSALMNFLIRKVGA